MGFICGTDVGGTFTDCVAIDEEGVVTIAKAPSTPDEFSRGVFDALEAVASSLEMDPAKFIQQVDALFHGTTVATNAMVQRRGVDSAMLMTAGHRDALHIMRGSGRTAGLPPEQYLRLSSADKPEPIVPRRRIAEIHERVDSQGHIVVELNEDAAREAIRALAKANVRSVGVCLLWSFQNPKHELRLREILEEELPDAYLTLSHELIPKWGEYERAAGVAINGYIGPLVADYLTELEDRARERGMSGPIIVMQASGGLATAERVTQVAINTIGSGPVAGVSGSAQFGRATGAPNLICADMGGTTFDVGLVVDGQPVRRSSSVLHQFSYNLPQVDVRSVGAGGGSIAWLDPASGALRVGPHSAGADPGPAAYGRGGEDATVTDADVVLGLIDPDNFLGGEMKLDAVRSRAALDKVGGPLGMSTDEIAAGVVQVVEAQMAELIRQMTVASGYDPRDFVVYAYGGASGTHAVGYASALGAQSVIVPMLDLGAVWSAYGVAASDLVELVERTEISQPPYDLDHIDTVLTDITRMAEGRLRDQGVDDADISVEKRIAMRFTAQINEVEVVLDSASFDQAALDAAIEQFERRYAELYGQNAGFAGAGIELVTFVAEGRGRLEAQRDVAVQAEREPSGEPVRTSSRTVYWHQTGRREDTDIYDGSSLRPGHVIAGPAIAELPHTTIAVPPSYEATMDESGSCVIPLREA